MSTSVSVPLVTTKEMTRFGVELMVTCIFLTSKGEGIKKMIGELRYNFKFI
jgi:hypothetical protein